MRGARSSGRRLGAAVMLAILVAGAIAGAALGMRDSGGAAESLDTGAASDLAAYARTLRDSGDPYFGTRQLDYLAAQLEDPTYPTDTWRLTILRQLGFHRLRLGDVDEAVRLLTEAAELAGRPDMDDPNGRDRQATLEELAVARVKRGEIRNCVSPTGRLVCALPLNPNLRHDDADDVKIAIGILRGLLETDANGADSIRRRWLLNVAHMAAGSYPDGVDARFLIPPETFAPEYPLHRFTEVSAESGIYSVGLAGGAIIEDFNGDGRLDIMTSSWDPSQSLRLYVNAGKGRFLERTESAGLSAQTGGLNIVQTDYDNDGDADVLVMRGGWLMSNGQMRRSLLANDGDGTFTDVTRQAGLATPAYPSQSAAWADFDNDGDLDLFSCNESMPESPEPDAPVIFPSQLFVNEGGKFTDVTPIAGVSNLRYCKGSAWGDYDNDGDADLYVSNYAGENRLYRNDGGAFTDVAPELGVSEPIESFAAWFWDYDNDGWLDLFIAGYARDIDSVAADYMGLPTDGARPRLYRNDGASGFADITDGSGLDDVQQTMGANFGDFDNDGFLDILLGTGFPSFDALAPNIAYRNDGAGGFADVTFAAGLGHMQKGHGVAFGDLDGDGDQDVFMQVGGFYPSDGFPNALYQNPANANRWLTVRLVGVQSNRPGIGARVRVDVETAGGDERSVHALVGSGGSFGASSLQQEIGLGDATAIKAVEVWWPASGTRQRVEGVSLDSVIEVVEGDNIRIQREAAKISVEYRRIKLAPASKQPE